MSDTQGPPTELLMLDIQEIIQFFISITSTKSVMYLGAKLTEESEPVKDLEKARISIDTTKLLVDKLKPSLGEDEAKQLDQMIMNLQMALVKES